LCHHDVHLRARRHEGTAAGSSDCVQGLVGGIRMASASTEDFDGPARVEECEGERNGR
jgi:hypothetical protein